MATVHFSAVIGIRGVNPYVRVSAPRANSVKRAWRRPLPVRVRINGKPEDAWRIRMMPAGDGSFYLYLHGEVRKASGTRVGDRVRVAITFDQAYRGGPQHAMPRWFREALARDPKALRHWKALVPSRKKEVLRYLARLRSPDARLRNLARALHVLSGGRGRFLGRPWKDGS